MSLPSSAAETCPTKRACPVFSGKLRRLSRLTFRRPSPPWRPGFFRRGRQPRRRSPRPAGTWWRWTTQGRSTSRAARSCGGCGEAWRRAPANRRGRGERQTPTAVQGNGSGGARRERPRQRRATRRCRTEGRVRGALPPVGRERTENSAGRSCETTNDNPARWAGPPHATTGRYSRRAASPHTSESALRTTTTTARGETVAVVGS